MEMQACSWFKFKNSTDIIGTGVLGLKRWAMIRIAVVGRFLQGSTCTAEFPT